jgi:hypothetical protein
MLLACAFAAKCLPNRCLAMGLFATISSTKFQQKANTSRNTETGRQTLTVSYDQITEQNQNPIALRVRRIHFVRINIKYEGWNFNSGNTAVEMPCNGTK